ncbi:TetR/AcrR family transcriptional regulator C-terminal domain-containing protein [Saccharomonospora sp. NPDC006951]
MQARRTPGQRAGLSRQAVLEAALALVDREGLRALSMRRLGSELGVEAMTLYNHVSHKDALLDGLVEQVVVTPAVSPFGASSWRVGLRDFAHAFLAALRAHPNVIPLVVSRPAATSLNQRMLESVLGSLCEAGFSVHRALDVVHSVAGFVAGYVATTPPDDGTVPPRDLDADEFPLLAAAMCGRTPSDSSNRFDFALDAMLCGFGAALTSGD